MARGALRSILSRYLGIKPDRVRIGYGPYGKPSLDRDFGLDIEFNLAHSRHLALLAVARGRSVGVDLEWVRPEVAQEGIAERFFSPWEVEKLREAPAADRVNAFFRTWTRKEAYIKARGEGLSVPLHEFSVSLSTGERPRLMSVEGSPSETSRWSFFDLNPAKGYVAVVAVEGSIFRLVPWNYDTQ